MPSRDYEPSRYGPTVSTRVDPASRNARSTPATALSEEHERREHHDNLQFAKSLRSLGGTHAKRAGVAGLWPDSQRASGRVGAEPHELASASDDGGTPKEDRFRRPGEARAAPATRPRATTTALSSIGIGPGTTKLKQERFHLHHAELLSPFANNTTSMTTAPASFESTADTTASATSDTAGASASPGARGRTRRRSLTWHLRQKMTRLQLSPASTYCSSSFSASPAAAGHSQNINSYSSSGGGSGCHEAATGEERATTQKRRGRRRRGSSRKSGRVRGQGDKARGESIDAEELFRRKNKISAWNVTYGRWAKSYDRSMARRASLERLERLELQREENERRQRAEEEFQKWVRNHAPRSASSPSPGAAAATATTISYASAAAAAGLGPRSSYHERAASASPLRRQWLQKRQKAWTDGEGEADRDVDAEGGGAESEGLGGGSDRCRSSKDKGQEAERERERENEEREKEEEKRCKVDRAFRAWLDRKKKQAQAEREAQQRREKYLAKLRKLEASRRWKKRPVVCAYTYGAKIGAQNWKDEPIRKEGGGGQHDRGQEKEKEEGQGQEQEGQAKKASDGEEEGDGDGLEEGGAREWKTENREGRTGERARGPLL